MRLIIVSLVFASSFAAYAQLTPPEPIVLPPTCDSKKNGSDFYTCYNQQLEQKKQDQIRHIQQQRYQRQLAQEQYRQQQLLIQQRNQQILLENQRIQQSQSSKNVDNLSDIQKIQNRQICGYDACPTKFKR